MKNIIVGILTLIIFGLMAWTAMNGGAYNGGIHTRIIADIGNKTATASVESEPQEKSDREKESEELSALREKAGNIGNFKVSDEYKSKCSSCHGVDGSGMQYGKKLMGPKLFGQSADTIYKKLDDFKSGRKENMVNLRRFANEIGEFPARAKAMK